MTVYYGIIETMRRSAALSGTIAASHGYTHGGSYGLLGCHYTSYKSNSDYSFGCDCYICNTRFVCVMQKK